MAVLIDPASGKPVSDELLHYGVLGMKWGVRHDRRSGSSRSGRSSRSKASGKLESMKREFASNSDEAKRTRVAKARAMALNQNRFTISDEKLNRQINRLQRQKQLRELTDSEVTPRRKAAKEIASAVAKTIGTAALSASVVMAIDATLGRSRSSLLQDFGDMVDIGVKNRGGLNGKKKKG